MAKMTTCVVPTFSSYFYTLDERPKARYREKLRMLWGAAIRVTILFTKTKEACQCSIISFSSQSNYINNKKKLPGIISALHCSVEPEVLYKIKKELFIEYLHDTISGHFGVVNFGCKIHKILFSEATASCCRIECSTLF